MESQYRRLLLDILNTGTISKDRTGVGTKSTFHNSIRYNLNGGFPLLTSKKMFLKGIIHELLWFISGSTNIKYLQDNNVHIWDQWANENGDLGKVYGYQLRKQNGKNDVLKDLIDGIKNNPYGRRHVFTLWNHDDLKDMALPPCHGCFVQFYVRDGKLSCSMYQRSADMFLGVPFDIAMYGLLTMMIAQVCNLKPDILITTFGDTHIYLNHINQVKELLSRKPFNAPKMIINPNIKDIDLFNYNDFNLINYKSHSSIKATVAV